MAKLKVGIIGVGGRGIMSFGRLLTQNHADSTEVVAFADLNRERAEAGRDLLKIEAEIYASVPEMLARKDIAAVVVTSPDYLHGEHCVQALEHGKHVLVDKPLAVTGEDCLRVIEAAKRADRLLYMGFNLRHDVVLRRLKSLVESGELGEIFSMQAIEHYDGGRTYMSRWNRLKKYSGGLFIHKGSHDFDIINWIMGTARPVRVSCFANNFVFKKANLPFALRAGVEAGPSCSVCKYFDECPDHYAAVAPWSDDEDMNAARRRMWGEAAVAADGYHKDLCMYLSDKDTHDQGIAIVEYDTGATASHSEYFATPFSNRYYMLEGMRGHAEASLDDNKIEIRPRWTQDRVVYNVARGGGGHGGTDPNMVAEFVRCLQEDLRPTASGIDGTWSVAIGEACEISRAEGRVVAIKEVLEVASDLLKG